MLRKFKENAIYPSLKPSNEGNSLLIITMIARSQVINELKAIALGIVKLYRASLRNCQ